MDIRHKGGPMRPINFGQSSGERRAPCKLGYYSVKQVRPTAKTNLGETSGYRRHGRLVRHDRAGIGRRTYVCLSAPPPAPLLCSSAFFLAAAAFALLLRPSAFGPGGSALAAAGALPLTPA